MGTMRSCQSPPKESNNDNLYSDPDFSSVLFNCVYIITPNKGLIIIVHIKKIFILVGSIIIILMIAVQMSIKHTF